ncbi:MAG TPA: hypothetical protein VNM67_22195 [Thermoanaerobaculia bacterium]|jgi:hypothetical protein|nr:hypothetical protein [Thermoanaerobaculia bacterium]
MKRLLGLLLAAVVLTAASCEGEKTVTEPGDRATEASTVELTTIVQQSIPGGGGGTVREVIRDQVALAAMWTQLGLSGAPPVMDFEKEMVIAAAMETQSCVSRVTIRSASEQGGELAVDILEAPPAPNCVCITAERPIHLVRLRKVAAPPRYNVERGQTPC